MCTDSEWVNELADPQMQRCSSCGATSTPGVWWCPQCYTDLRPASVPAPDEDESTAQLPVQRRTDGLVADPGTTRAAYRLSRASALDAAMAREAQPEPPESDGAADVADVEAVADELLAELAAQQPQTPALRVRSTQDKLLLGVGATAVMMGLLLGLMLLVGLLSRLA